MSGAGISAQPIAAQAWTAEGRACRVLRFGDSTTGTGVGTNPTAGASVSEDCQAYGTAFQRIVREEAGDPFVHLGTRWALSTTPARAADGWHEGHPGYKIEELDAGRGADGNTGYPGWIAQIGVDPDVVMLLAPGTNNFATDNGATCITKTSALIDTITTTTPNAWLVICLPKPSATASPNDTARALLAANLLSATGVARISEATGLRRSSRVLVCDAELQAKPDGNLGDVPAYTHPDHEAKEKIARTMFETMKRGIPELLSYGGPKWPRPRGKGPAAASLAFDGGSGSRVSWATNAGMAPGSGSFMLCFRVWHTSLAAQGQIFRYGTSTNYLTVLTGSGGVCDVYQGTQHVMQSVPDCFVTGREQSVLLAYDSVADITTLFVDGVERYRYVDTSLYAGYTTPPAGENLFLGGLGVSAITGYLQRLVMCRGVDVPGTDDGTGDPGSLLRRTAEAWDRDRAVPPGVTGYYALDDAASPTVSYIGGTASSSWASGVTSSPAGTPAWASDEPASADPDRA